MATPELTIINRICQGLQNKLSLTFQQCHIAAARTYVRGQGQRVLKIVPDRITTDGGANGGQRGNLLQRRLWVTVWVWYRLKTDMPGLTVDLVTKDAQGMIDFVQSVKDVLKLTFLGYAIHGNASSGSLLMEPMYYESETTTQWHDEAKGEAYRGIVWSMPFGEVLPNTQTLVDSDFSS